MAKTKPAPIMKEIGYEELPEWIRSRMGDATIAEFAAQLGFTRNVLGCVLSGTRPISPRLLEALRPYGLRGSKVRFLVEETHG